MTYDYDSLKDLSKQIKRPATTLKVTNEDPFYIEPSRQEWGEWLARAWERHGLAGHKSHTRRIHYVLVSHTVMMPDGRRYLNTEECFNDLNKASRAARYLGLIPLEDYSDQRNPEAQSHLTEQEAAHFFPTDRPRSMPFLLPATPNFPTPQVPTVSHPVLAQRYHVEIWIEKSTCEDILQPLARRYRLVLQTGTGDMSLTRCHEAVQRAVVSQRPVRILYISDFDPKGHNMPVAAARKIEWMVRTHHPHLDIKLIPIILTLDQCKKYELPRIPLSDKDPGRAEWERRFGEGRTELDALEALHPGALGHEVEQEILRYYDPDFDRAVRDAFAQLESDLDDTWNAVLSEHAPAIDRLKKRLRTLDRDLMKQLKPIYKYFKDQYHAVNQDVDAILGTLVDQINDRGQNVVDEFEFPEPAAGDELDAPLFDTALDYVEQVDRYKLYQGKPIARKARS